MSATPLLFSLTPRELNLLRHLAAGFSEQEVAEWFGRSLNTIKARRRTLLRKLGARNRGHAVALGYEWRLLEIDPDTKHRGPSIHTTLGQVAAWRRRAQDES
jgi:DNA-binding CsgD family transcriptional regulator